jgi:hypothetical protein
MPGLKSDHSLFSFPVSDLGPHFILGAESRRDRGEPGGFPPPVGVPLREQLARLQRRSKAILGCARLQRPACLVLNGIAHRALGLTRRIHYQIQSSDHDPRLAETANAFLQQLLDTNQLLLDQLEEQMQVIDSACRQAVTLAEIVQRLLAQEPIFYDDLLNSLTPILQESCPVLPSVAAGLAWPGLSLNFAVAAETGRDELSVVVPGWRSARLLNAVLNENPFWSTRLPLLTAAAALQDVGIAASRGYCQNPGVDLDRVRQWYDQHPRAGAGITGVILQAPPELRQIIAQHHERIGGGGFPGGRMAGRMSKLSRLVSTANRFIELYDELSPAEEQPVDCSSTPIGDHLNRVAARLLDEADEGHWDGECSTLLVDEIKRRFSHSADMEARPGGVSIEPSAGLRPPAFQQSDGVRESEQWKFEQAQLSLELHGSQPDLEGFHLGRALSRMFGLSAGSRQRDVMK